MADSQFVRVHLTPFVELHRLQWIVEPVAQKTEKLLLIVNFQQEIPPHMSLTTPTTRTDTHRHRRRRVIRHLGPDRGRAHHRVGQLDASGNIYVGVDKRQVGVADMLNIVGEKNHIWGH
jgi:hypothetical protein